MNRSLFSSALLVLLVAAAPACQISTGSLLGKGASPAAPAASNKAPSRSAKNAGASPSSTSSDPDSDAPATKAAPSTKGERLARYKAASVVTKLPRYKAEDSYDLDKIAEAFAALDKSAVVITKGKELTAWSPSSEIHGVTSRTRGSCGTKPLEVLGGGYLRESSGMGAIQLEFDLCNGDYAHVPEGTPGVVWSTESRQEGQTAGIVFVTLDGGRYTMEDHEWLTPVLAFEAPPAAAWPKMPIHSFLGPREAATLPDAQAKAATQRFDAAKTAWDACMSPVLDREEAEYKSNGASAASASQREAKNAATEAKFEKLRDSTCGKKKNAIADGWLTYLTDRQKRRAAILEANKDRFGK